VFPIEIPPLRRRRGDIPILAEAFVERFSRELGRRGLRLSPAAAEALARHPWPGNVRELQNCLERAAILCEGSEIQPADLRLVSAGPDRPRLSDVLDLDGELSDVRRRALASVEQECVRLALDACGGDREAAAARLGISAAALSRRSPVRPRPR
jgi:DNA-binding NtrC family response regulator